MESSADRVLDANAERVPDTQLQGDAVASPRTRNGYDLDVFLDVQSRQRALIVDDDSDTVQLLKMTLQQAGIDVMGALDGYEAIRKLSDAHPDIVLLDLMMPELDGLETLRMMRRVHNVPIVIVSAKATKEDIVEGLNAGGDDYVPKPFHPGEVVARVNAVLRRTKPAESGSRIAFPKANLAIDFETREVIIDGNSIQFTPKTFAVLEVLARNAPRPVSHKQIAEEVWGEDTPKIRKRIKYTILLIRRKLGDRADRPRLVLNRPAFGYQLQTEPDAENSG